MTFAKVSLLASALALAGCGNLDFEPSAPEDSQAGEAIARGAQDYQPLGSFPQRKQKIKIAVYEFPDLTGQHKPNQDFAQYSKAVSQGADAFVVSALRDVGQGTWFNVLERRFSESILNERRIAIGQTNEARQRAHTVRELERVRAEERVVNAKMRDLRMQAERDYAQFAKTGLPADVPPYEKTLADLDNFHQLQLSKIAKPQPFSAFALGTPIANLVTADYLVTGAIVGYDSDIQTAGAGARFLNVGAFDERRKDVMTVNVRLVRASTGEIVGNETVTQKIVSVRTQGDVLSYTTINRVLEFEAGYATNEPGTFALDAAIRVALSKILQEQQRTGRW